MTMTKRRIAVVIVLISLTTQWWQPIRCHTADPVVHIGNTSIQGLRNLVGDRPVHSFLGIRYAQAPKGRQRFKPPVQEDLPLHVDATRFGARCAQFPLQNMGMSEDCLFLNIYSPPARPGHLWPVLVWIHGGAFIVGAGDAFQGEVLAAEGQMIVATFNYRLGVLGFLCTGDDSSGGNFGLQDQQIALKWMQDYIGYFGGDAGRVTLGGVSAGAASVSIHSLSPLSRDLFHRVIQMSGSASSPWARRSSADGLEAARALAARLDCFAEPHNTPTHSLVNCMRKQRLARLIKASTVLFPRKVALSLVDHSWGPVEDGVLVTDPDEATPFTGPLLAGLIDGEGDAFMNWNVPRVSRYILDVRQLLRQRRFYRHQLLPTLLKQAYPSLIPYPYPDQDTTTYPSQDPYPYPPPTLRPDPSKPQTSSSSQDHRASSAKDSTQDSLPDPAHGHHPDSALDVNLRPMQPPLSSPGQRTRQVQLTASRRQSFSQLLDSLECVYLGGGGLRAKEDTVDLKDLAEVCGDQAFMMGSLRDLDRFGPSQRSYLYFVDQQVPGPRTRGRKHNDDVAFLFGVNSTIAARGQVNDFDLRLGDDFRQLVINFIKTGDPNDPARPSQWPPWPAYTSKGAHYLHLSKSPTVRAHLKRRKMELWTEEVPRVLASSGNVSFRWCCVTSSTSGLVKAWTRHVFLVYTILCTVSSWIILLKT